MALEEGVYNILCVQTKKGIEVQNGSDANGANIQMWTRHGGDSQIWCLTKTDTKNGNDIWQVCNSMSGKVMGVKNATLGSSVVQKDDNDNEATERWIIRDTGKTASYSGTSYPIYVVNLAGDIALGLDVAYQSTADGANLAIYQVGTGTTSTNQQWIFVKLPVLSENGFYKIIPRGGIKNDGSYLCVTVNEKNGNDGAEISVTDNDENNDAQVFLAKMDESNTDAFQFIAGHSGKAIAIPSTANADKVASEQPYVQQSTAANNQRQKWLPVALTSNTPNKTVKIGNSSVRVYRIRSQFGNNNLLSLYKAADKSKSRPYLHPAANADNINQQWVFLSVEGATTSLKAPGEVYILSNGQETKSIVSQGPGDVTISGLRFRTESGNDYKTFQARYHICTYNASKSKVTWLGDNVSSANDWINPNTKTTARYGWGLSNEPTFSTSSASQASKSGNVVTIANTFFSEVVTLDTEDAVSAELTIQIRAFKTNAVKSGKKDSNNKDIYVPAHGPTTESKITITQIPITSVSSVGIGIDSNGVIAVKTVVSNSPNIPIASLRTRLIGSDGRAISDWATSSSLTVWHTTSLLFRFPHSNESLTVEYYQITAEGNIVTGSSQVTFTNSSSSITFDENVTYTTDDSCCAIIRSNQHQYDYCLACVQGVDDTQIVVCTSKDESVNNVTKKRFMVAPSLNRDVQVILIGSNNGNTWGFKELTVHIDSHLFIWNWSYNGMNEEYNEYASILVNSDAPPQQTRSFTTDIKFNTPAGRVHPVGFSMSSLQTDLSVSGVVMDDDADYTVAAPIPQHVSISELRKLIMLSARGIHPIYRTPYGDYYSVGIESVDFSKTELGYSRANVKQRAIGD